MQTYETDLLPSNCKDACVYTKHPIQANASTITLHRGQGASLPFPQGGKFFFVSIKWCDGCVGPIKVVGNASDVLTIVPTPSLPCVPSNAKVCYDSSSIEYIQAAVGPYPQNTSCPCECTDCEAP